MINVFFIGSKSILGGYTEYYLKVCDNAKLEKKITIVINDATKRQFYPAHYGAAVVALAYEDCSHADIAKKIATWYATFHYKSFARLQYFVSIDKKFIDTVFPNLHYGNKYYSCVLNNLKMLDYLRKINYEKPVSTPI